MMTLALALSACESSNPIFGPGPGGDPPDVPVTPNTIPAELAGSIVSLGFDQAAGELTVEIKGFDADPIIANFERTADLDVRDSAGNIAYYAFITQDDPLDRLYTAYARTSTDGTVTGGIAADGGQFTRYFPGGYYRQNGTYVAPTETGLASFAGAYVAVTNLSGSGAHLLPVPPGTDPAVLPGEAERIVGTIFLNVHFGEDNVNGAIYNRRYVDGGGSLPDIFLLPADIAADGSFLSGVVLGDHTDIGSYGGVLGSGGGAIAGVVETTGYDGNPLSEERGLFVLTRCGLPGADVEVCSVAETLGE